MNYGEIGAIIIFFIGVYGIVARRNIVKTVISLGIMDAAIILYFVAAGGFGSQSAPIGDGTGRRRRDTAGADDYGHRDRHRGDGRGADDVYLSVP